MRKYQQIQIQKLLKTLEESLSEIKQLLLKRNFSSLLQILTDSQEFVIQIGTYIEKIEGEGTQTVTLLEEYHELLYHAAVNLDINGSAFDNKLIKNLKKLLFKIENSVISELRPDKFEIVFFPYKASMWDTMESVWLATKDDPQCDAYVVPIPYYDRRPDGSFEKEHYEGNDYPDYVPIVDYRTYDLELRQPDAVFVHNPYDSQNIITSVHPDYYSERLKNFTDLLVYIPYFVSTGNVGEHLCTCPGSIYADKVILQSEEIRDIYIREFKEFEKKNNCKNQFGKPESKFIALGSPKFDKIINSKAEDFTIPDEWQRLIVKPDGTIKKIVLYNTSIAAILHGNEQYLRKMRHVLGVFQEREDVVLWWRPHPLSIQTYESMRPKLLAEYKNIISEYKKAGFGIYDDSTDLNRAMAISSCYYGDMSSLVSLYQCTGKPVLLQMIFFNFLPQEHVLFFDSIIEYKNEFLISSFTYNAFFKVNIKSQQVNFIDHFPGERLDEYNLYHSMVQWGEEIYFAPARAKEMAIFNPHDNSFRKVAIPEPSIKTGYKESQVKFNSIYSFGKFIYLIGYCYPAILQYDPIEGSFKQFFDWLPEIERLRIINKKDDNTYLYGAILVGEELLAVSATANAIVAFNMSTCSSTVYEVGEKGGTFSGICFDGRNYWLSPHDGSIVVRWNRETGESKCYETNVRGEGCNFIGTVFVNGYVWLLPYGGGSALCIDPQNEQIKKVDDFCENFCEQSNSYRDTGFSMIREYHGKILSFADRSADLIDFSPKDSVLKRYHLNVNGLPKNNFNTHYGNFMENGLYTLYDYIDEIALLKENNEDLVQRAKIRRQITVNGNGTAGEAIYEHIKKQIL
jgi:hypothetical protein